MAKVMITVAPTGAESSTAVNPSLPVTVEEIVQTAIDCERVGASMIHIHARDENQNSSLDLGRLSEIMQGVRAETGLIIQLSTGGGVQDSFADRLRVLELAPESCSLSLGTLNFGEDVFQNPWNFIVQLYKLTQEIGILPEFEIFDLGHLATLDRLLLKHGLPFNGHVHCDLVLGVPGGAPGTAETVTYLSKQIPVGASWSATGVGRTTLPVALATLAHGGHLRVGMEDVLRISPTVLVSSNAQLVERAAGAISLAQHEVASSEQARQILHLGKTV